MFQRCLVAAAILLATATPALAGAHSWRVNEVFSDPTGTIQFIELREGNADPGSVGVPGHLVMSTTKSFTILGPMLIPPTTLKTLLFATPACAALPGFPTPDYIFPAASVPFFSITGDTIFYGPGFDTLAFGAGELPTDGYNSIHDSTGFNVVAPNSPKNYAGQFGTVNAGPWINLGFGLAGAFGVPQLLGIGFLTGGSPTTLELSSAKPSTPVALWVGLASNPTPFKGGLLVPLPYVAMLPAVTHIGGKVTLNFPWPTGLPSGLAIYLQYSVSDPAGVKGVALSNCLKATTP